MDRIEVFLHVLERFRAVATRFDKTARNFLGLIELSCSAIWLDEPRDAA